MVDDDDDDGALVLLLLFSSGNGSSNESNESTCVWYYASSVTSETPVCSPHQYSTIREVHRHVVVVEGSLFDFSKISAVFVFRQYKYQRF